MAIALVSQWMVQFPLAYVLSTQSGLAVQGIWWSFPVSNVATALLALAWFARGDWKRGRLTQEIEQTVRINDEAIEEGAR
jgi:Na+-driven multidrug efflux pump